MSRKIERSIWRDDEDGRRKRRTGLVDKWKAHQSKPFQSQKNKRRAMEREDRGCGEEQGPPSRTRARVKRKLQDVELNSVSTIAKQGRGKPNHDYQLINCDQPLVLNAKESPKHDDHAPHTGQPSVESSMQSIPEKLTLELILDVLQRRDTYEIFSEPVDPEEVEDYYEIIDEPMDFGTMRAKLHEGMYKTLEQFEHDVFLISQNAMHFNSSATIYFRQARAIHELAKKVFHVLKTDPENFISKFSGTRRRSGRRLHNEAKDLNSRTGPRLSTDVRPSSVTIDVSSKRTPCSFSGPSIFRRSIRGNPRFANTVAHHVDIRDCDFLSGAQGYGRSISIKADRRCTYRPWMFFHDDNDSTVSKIHNDPKPLVLVNQRDISYGESLMLFVKNLGPTAQMIAKRKLQGLSGNAPTYQTPRSDCRVQAPICQIPATVASAQSKLSTLDTFSTSSSQKVVDHLSESRTVLKPSSDIIDLTDADDGDMAYSSKRVGNLTAPRGEVAPNNEGLSTRDGMNVLGVFRIDKVNQNRSTEIQLDTYSSNDGAASVSDINKTGTKPTAITDYVGKLDDKARPFNNNVTKFTAMTQALASEQSQSNDFEFKLRKKNSSASSSWLSQTSGVSSLRQTSGSTHNLGSRCHTTAVQGQINGVCNSSQTSSLLESNASIMQSPSQFTFDLPFLKAQLNQMNFMGQDRFLQPKFQRGMGTNGPLFDRRGYKMAFNCTQQAEPSTLHFLNNQPPSSLDSPDTDLTLQL